MKFRYLMMSLLAVSALAAGCKEEEEDLGLPQITVAGDGITFDATTKKASLEAGADLSSHKTTVTANRPWTVEVTYGSAEQGWIAATPDHGNASTSPQEVVLTLLPNEGRDRTATVKYNIGYDYKTLIVNQKGALGSVEDATLYANNFDKETATQTFGTNGTSWPYLDQFNGWQNETGIGAANVTYDYSGMSVRNNSNSNGSYSDYEGSGVNNLFFGNSAYITIGNIDISASNNLRLTFGAEKYLNSGSSVFDPAEFTVMLSGDGNEWSKPISFSFTKDYPEGRWDLATADFTVPENVKTLYIRFAASVASAYRLDDVTLIIGDGGDLVELTGGSTDPGTGGDEPADVKAVTVSEFIAAPESSTQVYELTGRISGSINTTYGNFDLVDDSGSVYVYGLTATNLGYGAKNDNSYASLGLNAGDEIKIRGYRGSYGDKVEVMYAWFIEKLSSGSTDPGTDPGTGSKFESDAAFVCSANDSGNSSYTLDDASGSTTFNGERATGFKLGTASKTGKFTSSAVGVEGDYTLSFYGVAWKGQKGTVKISVSGGGSVEGSDTFELRSNDGATGNPPFTITLDETTDHYSVVLKGLTKTSTVSFETATNAYRAVVAGIHLTEGTDGGSTDPGTGGDEPADVKAVTVSEFIAAPESSTQVYELTGRISGSINTTYGNFDLVDDSGSVYVYGLTATDLGYGATNDKSYGSLGLNAGDEIKIRGYRGSYGDKVEVMYAWFIEKLSSGSTDPGTDPGTGSKFESDEIFVCSADNSSNASYTLGATKINGQSSSGFKLGTASKIGKFTSSAVGVEGDYTLSFYGVAWKGQKGTVKISVSGGGSVEGSDTFELRSNDGATGNPAFTISLDETADHYSVVLKGLTKTSTVTFETVTNAYRAVVAGIHLTDSGTTGGGTPSTETETIDFSTMGLENGVQYPSFDGNNFSVKFGDGANDGKYYTTGTGIRIYGDGYVQISSEHMITEIVYTFASGNAPTGDFTVDTGSYEVGSSTWTGEAKSVKLTRATGSGHWRLQKIEVTYTK